MGFSSFPRQYAATSYNQRAPSTAPERKPLLQTSAEYRRAGWFTCLLLLVNVVGDGWSGRPGALAHQLILLPVTLLFLFSLFRFLSPAVPGATLPAWKPRRATQLALMFEVVAAGLFLYECRHFAFLGYTWHPVAGLGFGVLILLWCWCVVRNPTATRVMVFAVATYAGGLALAILSFPLNYLRSDMLPVILWANTNLLHGVSPYATMHVGARVYDFPYLPGMLVGYLPFVATGLDVRFGSMIYVCAASRGSIFWAADSTHRREVASLLTLFLLCPFLQYRHELYLAPHWFAITLAFFLMQRRHFAWAAVALGASMAIYQFSWILFPFFALCAFRRRGWLEALKLTILAAAGALAIVGPFLSSALHRMASNTVSQWSLLPHALAEPMNLSFWATFLIRPDKLLRLQAVLMIAIFLYCVARKRCQDLVDTLRWMIVALTVFILFNVLVDGYFYLMLLVPMLVFTCAANQWWSDPYASEA